MPKLILFGASGAVGRFLIPLLTSRFELIPVSRAPRAGWLAADLHDTGIAWPDAAIAISLGPLDAFASWLERQANPPRRVIALSSMSAESKRGSTDPAERALSERLRVAEAALFEVSRRHGTACTILRPTLIYGAGSDRSLAPIARFARRWHVLPVPFGASGLRQPIHAADLAAACAAVIESTATHGKTYALGGGERLRFDAMIRRLREAVPGFAVALPAPVFALRLAARIAPAAVGGGAVARLREDLVADNRAAQADFGFAPRGFIATDVPGGKLVYF